MTKHSTQQLSCIYSHLQGPTVTWPAFYDGFAKTQHLFLVFSKNCTQCKALVHLMTEQSLNNCSKKDHEIMWLTCFMTEWNVSFATTFPYLSCNIFHICWTVLARFLNALCLSFLTWSGKSIVLTLSLKFPRLNWNYLSNSMKYLNVQTEKVFHVKLLKLIHLQQRGFRIKKIAKEISADC